jgi:hypothetical protein
VLKTEAAATGSTGNATHTAREVDSPSDAPVAFQFIVEAIGATPTVTYKWQGSVDGTNFFDLAYITDATATEAVTTRARTTVSADILFLALPQARVYRHYRLVTSANTNVTYRAEIYVPD